MNSFLVGGGEPRTTFSSKPDGSSPTSSVAVEFMALLPRVVGISTPQNNQSFSSVVVRGSNILIFPLDRAGQ